MCYATAICAREEERPSGWPRAYLVTFTCYGSHLHGDPAGSIDRYQNLFGSRLLDENPGRIRYERWKMNAPPQRLKRDMRVLTLRTIQNACRRERWRLLAAHVRSTHVHVIVMAERRPEHVMGKLKSCVSRALNEAFGRERYRWTRHGSTRWLWEPEHVKAAVHYVLHQQGRPMSKYEDPEWQLLATEPRPRGCG